MTSLAAIMNLHREGILAHPSIRSFAQCCRVAEDAGVSVRRIAVLDRPDDLTVEAVSIHAGSVFDAVERCDFGDLGCARNFGVRLAAEDHVAFFDADDLWGDRWIAESINFLERQPHPERTACHPEYLYVFHASDFLSQSQTDVPSQGRSNILRFTDSADASFDKASLIFLNPYSSNSLARRDLYAQHPFPAVERATGYGVEDWWWNAQTLGLGIRHATVPNTVHLVRRRTGSSLSQQNVSESLLPAMHRLGAGLAGWHRR